MNIVCHFRFREAIVTATLRTAIELMCSRHALLRSRIFVLRGIPGFVVDEDAPPFECAERAGSDPLAAITDEANRPFAKGHGCLRAVVLVAEEGGEGGGHDILLTVRHDQFDAKSILVFLSQTMALYRQLAAGASEPPELPRESSFPASIDAIYGPSRAPDWLLAGHHAMKTWVPMNLYTIARFQRMPRLIAYSKQPPPQAERAARRTAAARGEGAAWATMQVTGKLSVAETAAALAHCKRARVTLGTLLFSACQFASTKHNVTMRWRSRNRKSSRTATVAPADPDASPTTVPAEAPRRPRSGTHSQIGVLVVDLREYCAKLGCHEIDPRSMGMYLTTIDQLSDVPIKHALPVADGESDAARQRAAAITRLAQLSRRNLVYQMEKRKNHITCPLFTGAVVGINTAFSRLYAPPPTGVVFSLSNLGNLDLRGPEDPNFVAHLVSGLNDQPPYLEDVHLGATTAASSYPVFNVFTYSYRKELHVMLTISPDTTEHSVAEGFIADVFRCVTDAARDSATGVPKPAT